MAINTNQDALNRIVADLKDSPLFNLSLSSKELFHSNFLYWLANEYPREFGEQFVKFSKINPDNKKAIEIKREKRNIDLSFEYSSGEKILIENKVKSIPNKQQLIKYSKEHNKDNIFILLSLSIPSFFKGKKSFRVNDSEEAAKWLYMSYEDLKLILNNIIDEPDVIINVYHKEIIKDYISLIQNLVHIEEYCTLSVSDKFNFHSNKEDVILKALEDLRIHDLYLKKKYEQLSLLIFDELNKKHDIKILQFGEDLHWETDDQVIRIGYDMMNKQGITDIKYKVAKNVCLGIQIQGEQYRLFVEDYDGGIAKNIKDELLKKNYWFVFNETISGKVYPMTKGKLFNLYHNKNKKETFFYKSKKLGTEREVTEIIKMIVSDIEGIKKNIVEIRKIAKGCIPE